MLKNKRIIIVPIIITIIKTILFVPTRVTGGIAGINKLQYKTIIIFLTNNQECNKIIDGLCYKILTNKYIIESITIFIISFIITIIIYKIPQNIRSDKHETNDK